jgi:(p)ppGpp synthase/HD superfamily hydrolase
MATIERAILIAAQAHLGQRDKAGAPYILHPLRMMMRMESEAAMIAAILHDVVEDSDWTLEQLRVEGFSEEILQAVDCLTRRDEESYDEFISRAKANAVARQVKIADLEDNMNVKRIGEMTPKDLARIEKYHSAWRILKVESFGVPPSGGQTR